MESDETPSTSKTASSEAPQKMKQFVLSSIIQAHSDDVKCVVESPNGALISGGRDGFLKFWQNQKSTWENEVTVQQEGCLAINSIAMGAMRESAWEYLLFVGRKNGSIAIFSLANPKEPIKVLQGHKSNVCALHFDEATGFMMSGSWDHQAVVWPVEQLLREDGTEVAIGFLNSHKNSVWAVATVPSKPAKFLTASADKSIKLWSDKYEEIGTFEGHQDVVRALLVLSESRFLSSSNDASINLWDMQSGTKLRSFLPQHDSFIYTLSRLNDAADGTDLVISAGEGGLIDIWQRKADGGLEHKQALKVPVLSIWSIAPMHNGDFAIATSSGTVLVFTREAGRKAADDLLEFFYSSQYEELAIKEAQTQKAKDSTFDMARFTDGGGENGGSSSMFHRIVGAEFGDNAGTAVYQDPFTGTGRYVPGSAAASVKPINTDKKRPHSHLVPLAHYYKFTQEGLSKKLFEVLLERNAAQSPALKMTEEELASTEQILSEAEFSISECQVVALEKGLQWPVDAIVPALDIFRIALLHPQFSEIFCSLQPVLGNPPKGRSTMCQLIGLLNNAQSTEPVRILACRALANAANSEFGRKMLLSEISAFCSAIARQLCSPKPALQIASASALANFARLLMPKTTSTEEMAELGPREDALRCMITALRNVQNFAAFSPVAVTRLLQAAIMLMWGQSTLIYCAVELDFGQALGRMKDAVADEDIKMLVRDAIEMMQAI